MKRNGLWILGFLGFLIVENIADRILDRAIEWIWPATPNIMFIIYNIVVTLITVAFGIAVVYALWRALLSIWKLLKYRRHRRNLWENMRERVRQWPTGKRDLFATLAVTWSIAIFVSFSAFAFSVPSGRFTAQELRGATLTTLLLAMTPVLLLIYWHFYEFVRDVWLKWRNETRNGRIKIAAATVAFILIFALMMWGDISGWEDRAWFAN